MEELSNRQGFVLFNGSQLGAYVLAYINDKESIPDAYYDDMNAAIDTAYAMGKTAATVTTTNVEVTYLVKHTHGTYCYPLASAGYRHWTGQVEWEAADGSTHYSEGDYYSYTCSVCGQSFTTSRVNSQSASDKQEAAWSSYARHLSGGRCTRKGYQCGKKAGEQSVTDVSILGAGDQVISATISF